MARVPVARRRYDITPAEMLDLARTAVDAVVAELQARTDQLVPDQLSRLEQVSASLAKTVTEVAESSYRSQMESVTAGLDAVRDDLSGAMAEHNARLVQAVENRLAGYDPAELSRRLPPAVASAVIDGLENALPTIDKGLHEVRELVGELVERGKHSELSRQNSLDRLDQVLVELRAGLSENVTRQHAVLLEMIDEKLSDLRLGELATELPGRIGTVISDAVQKSHDVQADSMQELASGLGRSLDAGLNRQRSATTELSATAERMAESVAGFSQVAEDAVTIAFERAQAAQAQRLNTMMRELREAQEEAAADLKTALDGAVQEMRTFQVDQAAALTAGLDESLGARVEATLAPQLQASAELSTALDVVVRELHAAREEDTASYEAQLERLGEDLQAAIAPQARAAVELRDAFDVVARELRASQREEAEVLSADLEQKLTDRMESIVLPHQESMAEATRQLTDVVAGQAEGVVARLDSVAEEMEQVRSATEAQRRAQESALSSAAADIERLRGVVQLQASTTEDALASQSEAVAEALESNAAAVVDALQSRSEALIEALESQSVAHVQALSTAQDKLTSHLSELMDTVSPRVSAELASVLEESRTRHERVEGLIAELAWIVGEQRAGSAGIREDLSRALEALPDAIASIQEASLRSEARIADLLARKLQGPDAR